jgi:hypothetical protein
LKSDTASFPRQRKSSLSFLFPRPVPPSLLKPFCLLIAVGPFPLQKLFIVLTRFQKIIKQAFVQKPPKSKRNSFSLCNPSFHLNQHNKEAAGIKTSIKELVHQRRLGVASIHEFFVKLRLCNNSAEV